MSHRGFLTSDQVMNLSTTPGRHHVPTPDIAISGPGVPTSPGPENGATPVLTGLPAEPLDLWFEQTLLPQSTPVLRRYVRRLVPGDPHQADDVVQETLVRAWQNRHTVATARSPLAWLSRVARNILIDWSRRRAARPTEVDEDVSTRIWEPGEQLYDAALDRTALARALRTLSPAHREVLLLVHYQDGTHLDVAGALDVPPGTVKSRVHYAGRELRQALIEQGVTGSAY